MVDLSSILQRLLELHPRSIDLSLTRMNRILDVIDNPQHRLPPVFHIAGTNGKGSTIAFLRAFLEASGKSVHVYTSPHLVRFNERIRLGGPNGGKLVSDQLLAEALQFCEQANNGEEITFFEITTAAALHLFANNHADALILEVGLGGRLDATNVIDKPEVSLITSISHDHEQWLGYELTDIAKEKAGVLKSNSPAIVAPQTETVQNVIESIAKKTKSQLIVGNRDFQIIEKESGLIFTHNNHSFQLPLPSLQGQHQFENLATAITAYINSQFWTNEQAIQLGIQNTNWPARLQRIEFGKLHDACPNGSELWLDGGHNPGAGTAIAKYISKLNKQKKCPLYLITGMLNTKDPTGYFEAFKGLAKHILTVPISSAEAGRSAEELAKFSTSVGLSSSPTTSVNHALEMLSNLVANNTMPPRILICGSLYLAGEVLKANNTLPD